jgi:hypothetical protein
LDWTAQARDIVEMKIKRSTDTQGCYVVITCFSLMRKRSL